MKVKMKFQCPCCDYFTLSERGVYDICPVCSWEDDGLDIDKMDEHSGPNHMTLNEGRNNFQKHGACDIKMVKNVLESGQRNNYAFQIRKL